MRLFLLQSMLLLSISSVCGCGRGKQELPPKAPRAVTAFVLREIVPTSSNQVTGSVRSWKTEQIGFEVAGRLDWVLEPGRNVTGQVRDADGTLLSPGTALAKIDSEQFEVAVASAEADLEVAQLERQVAGIRLNETIPEDIKSAESDLALARTEFARARTLRRQNAVTQAELDSALNRLETEQTRLASLRSTEKQARVELDAAKARVKRAEQVLRNAKRDLENTVLYASYTGQVADVDVVPGSIVSAGSPILTLQMMNPIKIDIEVSATQSRELQRRRQVGLIYNRPDGVRETQRGYVYSVDPSADPATRTFTVTILKMNEQHRPNAPAATDVAAARTQDLWPLNLGDVVSGSGEVFVVEDGAIEEDALGPHVWMATNTRTGSPLPPIIQVERKNITPSGVRIQFLGNWVFQQVSFVEGPVDSDRVVVGKLEFPDRPRDEWDGESVLLDSGPAWDLRPGDIVNVELDPELGDPGLFVPVEAIYEERGKTYLFAIVNGQARKIEVKVIVPNRLDLGSMMKFEPITEGSLAAGMEIVLGGVHFLNDQDAVRVVSTVSGEGVGR